MAKKAKKKRDMSRADCLDIEPPAGPEMSRFSSAIISLEVADGDPLNVHRSILQQCPELASADASPWGVMSYGALKTSSRLAGDALVSYLYTGQYKLLKWEDRHESPLDRRLRELKTQFEIYALARRLELSQLEDQVRPVIEWLARDLDVYKVIDAVRASYPSPVGNDVWFSQWITSTIKKAFAHPQALAGKTEGTPDFGDGASVLKMMFECMLETYAGMVESLPRADVPDEAPDVDSDTDDDTADAHTPCSSEAASAHFATTAKPLAAKPKWSDEENQRLLASFAGRSWTAAWELAESVSAEAVPEA